MEVGSHIQNPAVLPRGK